MSIIGITAGGTFLLGGGWAYWPIADWYSLEPKWEEGHAVTGRVVNPDDEPNRYSLIADYEAPDGIDPFLLLTVTQDREDTEEVEEDIPTGTPILTGRIKTREGWSTEYPLLVRIVTVTDEDDEEVWNGDVLVEFPGEVRRAVGPNNLCDFSVTLTFEEDRYVTKKLAFGEVTFRR